MENNRTYFTDDNLEKLNFVYEAPLDEYCLPNATIVPFDMMLNYYLKHEVVFDGAKGFDNVVFYDKNKGLYFFDPKTYEYFCPPTRKAQQSVDRGNAANLSLLAPRVGAEAIQNESEVDAHTNTVVGVVHGNSRQTRLRLRVNVEEAFKRITMLLQATDARNAVVIKDSSSLLAADHMASQRQFDGGEVRGGKWSVRDWDTMLFDMTQNRNALIWVTMPRDNLAQFEYFRDARRSTPGNYVIAKDKFTAISALSLGVGEIKSLINAMRLSADGLKVDFRHYYDLCAEISEKIMRHEMSLRDLRDIFDYMIKKGKILNLTNFDEALSVKLLAMQKEAPTANETYEQILKKYDKQEGVMEYIASVKHKAEGLAVRTRRAEGDGDKAGIGRFRIEMPTKTQFQRLLEEHPNAFNLHVALVGPPGTGKTTFAKIIAKAYREIGILPSEKFIKVTRSDLVGGYVGQTALKTREVINRAIGGTLFIDEAYSLARTEGDSVDYGREAIDTLVEAMTDRMGEFAVIIAGYDADIERMLKANEGLKSRFGATIKMDEYSWTTLANKFRSETKSLAGQFATGNMRDFKIDEDFDKNLEAFLRALKEHYANMAGRAKSAWASMRTVIQLAQNSVTTCSRRYSNASEASGTVASPTLLPQDMPKEEFELYERIFAAFSQDNESQMPLKGVEAEKKSDEKGDLDSVLRKPLTAKIVNALRMGNPASMLLQVNGGTGQTVRDFHRSIAVRLYREGSGSGSGCIISPTGLILTVKHVVSEMGVDKARIFHGSPSGTFVTEHNVELVASSSNYDLALVRITDGTPTPFYASLSDPLDGGGVRIGDKFHLIGYPFGRESVDGCFDYSVEVAGIAQEARDGSTLVETIVLQGEGKRGNSGSPLINEKGEIVGIFAGSTTEGDQHLVEEMNYALPIKYVFDEFVR